MKEGCPTDEVVLIALGIEALLKLFLFCHLSGVEKQNKKATAESPTRRGTPK